jgi:hypothetical protein
VVLFERWILSRANLQRREMFYYVPPYPIATFHVASCSPNSGVHVPAACTSTCSRFTIILLSFGEGRSYSMIKFKICNGTHWFVCGPYRTFGTWRRYCTCCCAYLCFYQGRNSNNQQMWNDNDWA